MFKLLNLWHFVTQHEKTNKPGFTLFNGVSINRTTFIKIQNRVWEVTNAYGKIRLDMSSKDWSYTLVKIIHKILFKSTCKYIPIFQIFQIPNIY